MELLPGDRAAHVLPIQRSMCISPLLICTAPPPPLPSPPLSLCWSGRKKGCSKVLSTDANTPNASLIKRKQTLSSLTCLRGGIRTGGHIWLSPPKPTLFRVIPSYLNIDEERYTHLGFSPNLLETNWCTSDGTDWHFTKRLCAYTVGGPKFVWKRIYSAFFSNLKHFNRAAW